MMTNLFSAFVPTSSMFNVLLNWMSTMIGILLIPSMYWIMASRYHLLWSNIMIILHKGFKTLLGSSSQNGSTLIFISLYSMILFNNFMGLFSHIFTSTSYLSMTLTLSLLMWLSFMIFGWHTTYICSLSPTSNHYFNNIYSMYWNN